MVAVRGFPRPLYPPDAAAKGKKHSVDGPDVEAYKRVVSRAGRWKWQAFDQDFSNPFSHGKSGQVPETGVAGVQRQLGIDDTGWVGEKTFNGFRSIIIPKPLSHAGEYAMDARSVELINAAWDMFKGKEPAPSPPVASAAQARLSKAIPEIGEREHPPNSNQCKYTDWYNMIGPWCAMFVTWCDQLGANPTNSFVKGSKYAYVPYMVSDARMGYNGFSITSDPQPGDLACFDWDWNGEFDHVGIFEKWTSKPSFQCIEGNTSTSNNSNGGEVMRRTRNKNSQDTVFIRVKET
jgi:hypothetical protein